MTVLACFVCIIIIISDLSPFDCLTRILLCVSILIYDSHSLVLVVCVSIPIYDSYRLVLVLCINYQYSCMTPTASPPAGLLVHTWIIYITQKLPWCVNSHHAIQTNTWHRPQAQEESVGTERCGVARAAAGPRPQLRPRSGPQAQEISLIKYDWLIFFFMI
jgi:hypothetical protein